MRVLVANAGSSSIKLSVVEPDGAAAAVATFPPADAGGVPAGLDEFLRAAPAFGAVGHRVVHGGADFHDAVRVLRHRVPRDPAAGGLHLRAVLAARAAGDDAAALAFDVYVHRLRRELGD